MFTLLSQMITKANLSGVTLMVRPTGNGRLSLVLCTESTNWQADDEKLKAALSQPLCIEGDVTELENQILTDLNQYSESFVRGAIASNADRVCTKTDNAVLEKTTNSKPTENEQPIEISDSEKPIKIGEEVEDNELF